MKKSCEQTCSDTGGSKAKQKIESGEREATIKNYIGKNVFLKLFLFIFLRIIEY